MKTLTEIYDSGANSELPPALRHLMGLNAVAAWYSARYEPMRMAAQNVVNCTQVDPDPARDYLAIQALYETLKALRKDLPDGEDCPKCGTWVYAGTEKCSRCDWKPLEYVMEPDHGEPIPDGSLDL
jgi:hypothetical protein